MTERAPFPRGYFNHFLLAYFIPKPYVQGLNSVQGLNFSCITVNVRVGLSSEQEAATAKYVEVNKLIRKILIEIAPFHGSRAGCSIHSRLLAWVAKINVLIIEESIYYTYLYKNECNDHWTLQRYRQLSLKISQNNHGQCKLPEINE